MKNCLNIGVSTSHNFCSGFQRYLNDEELAESETVLIESIEKDDQYALTFIGNVKDRVGKVKLVAQNSGGQVTTEATLTVSGRPPTFVEKPFTSRVLQGLWKMAKKSLLLRKLTIW